MKPPYPEISEQERFPIISEAGLKFLRQMRQHQNAPNWNWPNGEQLNQHGLAKVLHFRDQLFAQPALHATVPDWVYDFSAQCLTTVPFYRENNIPNPSFTEISTCSRQDLAHQVWKFVPDPAPLDELIVFSSSGTTGYPTRTPHHPFSAACGVPLIDYALQLHQCPMLLTGVGQMAINNLVAYPGAFTTAIVISCLQEAGCVRVNLDPSAWRHANDREQYLKAWSASVWLGDPVALGVMEELDTIAPSCIVSSILMLTDAVAKELRTRYGCTVIDLYAMTEAGIIAARDKHGHRVLPHDLHVEILDKDRQPLPLGAHGEVVLTGGRNPYLPLLRYRTGDYAALQIINGHRYLIGLEGRKPVWYRSSKGRLIHSMEVNRLLRSYPVYQFSISEIEPERYLMHVKGKIDRNALAQELAELFGSSLVIRFG
jgi:phenylacetate-CoA ligase